MDTGKTILTLCVSQSHNRESFADTIDKSLSLLGKNIRKRIVSCAIELIQNNLKYNANEDITVEIIDEGSCYLLDTYRNLDQETSNMLIGKIEEINSEEFDTVKKRFKDNLENEDPTCSTGNGLILCRLKSNDCIFANIDNNQLHIRLKFNKTNS